MGMIDKLGGAKKKGEKFIKLEEFYPIYSDVKKSKDTGSFEDFIECLKLYDKMENGTMMLGELEHILLSLGKYQASINRFEKYLSTDLLDYVSDFADSQYLTFTNLQL